MNFRLGELFCGPGGIAVGARESGFIHDGERFSISHEWANDFDRDTCQTYINNICPVDPESVICQDVRQLDLANLTEIDGLAFGFPCNDFSIVGEQKGFKGDFGPLYSYGVKVIKKFQPKFFVAENVGGLRNSNDGSAFQTIIQELTDCGYDVVANLYKF
ncbi:MAG: DNA (cytosine-5-)-methyltransferase, partial [Sphingobacteriaceae bacterium]